MICFRSLPDAWLLANNLVFARTVAHELTLMNACTIRAVSFQPFLYRARTYCFVFGECCT